MTDFEEDCLHFHGKTLTGKYKHYCPDFDFLPMDETCWEFEFCLCEWKEDEQTN